MAFCTNCGKEINDNVAFCPYCGSSKATPVTPAAPVTNYTPAQPADNGGFLWGLLGCCIPIAGLILYLVWKDTKPKTAKAAGTGALVAVIILVIYYILLFVIGIGIGVAGM